MKSGISARELITTLKKKGQARNDWSPKIPASEEKATTTMLSHAIKARTLLLRVLNQ